MKTRLILQILGPNDRVVAQEATEVAVPDKLDQEALHSMLDVHIGKLAVEVASRNLEDG